MVDFCILFLNETTGEPYSDSLSVLVLRMLRIRNPSTFYMLSCYCCCW